MLTEINTCENIRLIQACIYYGYYEIFSKGQQIMAIHHNILFAPPGSYETSLDISSSPRSLRLCCKQIKKVDNKLDGQPSHFLASMNVSNNKATFSQIHLDFPELGIYQPHLNFKILDENNNEVIPRTFYLQLLHKE